MSTFDSTINAGASYVVKDIYEPLRQRAGERELVWVGYFASAAMVGLGLVIALLASSTVLTVWVSIVMLLFPAFLVPFALRWYWARMNDAGFTAGVMGGFAAAAIFLGCDRWDGMKPSNFLRLRGVLRLPPLSRPTRPRQLPRRHYGYSSNGFARSARGRARGANLIETHIERMSCGSSSLCSGMISRFSFRWA